MFKRGNVEVHNDDYKCWYIYLNTHLFIYSFATNFNFFFNPKNEKDQMFELIRMITKFIMIKTQIRLDIFRKHFTETVSSWL